MIFAGGAVLVYTFSVNNQYISVDRTEFLSSFYPFDFLVIAKMWMCFLAIWVFNYFKQMQVPVIQRIISTLAKYSFSVFFLHNFIILFAAKFLRNKRVLFSNMEMIWLVSIVCSVLSCIICVFIATKIKGLTGKNSQYFIGS